MITRLAVVSALNNHLREPWPTLAGQFIFDSKIEPIEDMKLDKAFPCCVVYTDYDKDHWSKSGRTHADRLMTVTLELLVVQAEQDSVNGEPTGNYQLECPMTDSEIESTLDIFELQIFRALSAGTAASDAFNYICPAYVNAVSRRGASVEGGLRLAARQITLEMKALRDSMSDVIPPPIENFLAELEQHSDYRDRVDDIRSVYASRRGYTIEETAMRTFGYSRDLSSRLKHDGKIRSLQLTEISYGDREPSR